MMRTGFALVIAGLLCTTAPAVTATDEAVATPAVTSTASPDVTVGTWNVGDVSGDHNKLTVPEHLPWADREPAIVQQIVRSHVDVLGVQEVSASLGYRKRLVNGTTQFRDLRNSLNRTGLVRYALSSNRRSGSLNNRILYKPHKLRLLRQGSFVYHARVRRGPRYGWKQLARRGMVWAIFQVKATGARFLFTSTHLQPHDFDDVRFAQFREMMRHLTFLQRHHPHRPVVEVGDFNEGKCWDEFSGQFKQIRHVSSLLAGETCNGGTSAVRADDTHNAWIGSYNAFHRSLTYKRNCGLHVDGHEACTGNSLDRMFASNSLDVKLFEVVADMNEDETELVGVIPSDHYLLKAVLAIPK